MIVNDLFSAVDGSERVEIVFLGPCVKTLDRPSQVIAVKSHLVAGVQVPNQAMLALNAAHR